MKKYTPFLLFGLAVLVIFTIGYYIKNPLIPKIIIGETVFFIEIASSNKEKEKGLGDRDLLKPGWGMLFPYGHKEKYQFWMKGMKFPLDFVWIADKKVVDITNSVQPLTNSEITIVIPRTEADQILELNAGVIKATGIQIGDPVTFDLK